MVDVFWAFFNRLKEERKEFWAARTIQRWWKVKNEEIQREKYLRWLPAEIDVENCTFSDVDRVLKVLDDYALEKMAKLEKEPKLPKIIHLQRYIRSWLKTTRLTRCVTKILTLIRFKKVCQKFADRAPLKRFFYQYDVVHGEKIEKELKIKAKLEERERKFAAGEELSDTSSVKETKK